MNKNSIIGFVIIGAILIAFSWYNSKMATEQQALRKIETQQQVAVNPADTGVSKSTVPVVAADTSSVPNFSEYKDSMLIKASNAPEEISTLENDKIAIDLTNIGAQAKSVKVKNYFTHDSLDLILLQKNRSSFALGLYTNEDIKTDKFAFEKTDATDTSITYKLNFDSTAFIQFKYTLPEGSYMLSLDVSMVGMGRHIPRNVTSIDLLWKMDLPRLEKGYDNEKNYSTIVYKFPNDKGVEDLGLRNDTSDKDIRTKVEWFAFQQQFFSAILVAENGFSNGILKYEFYPDTNPDKQLMNCSAQMSLPYADGEDVSFPLDFYFGPNKFSTLKSYDRGFENIVPLGGWLIGWINRYIIILVFDFLGKFISSYGLIIFLLTLLIKIVISPLTHKSYMSSAKMRVLKPEIDKINAKFPKSEDAMKKQQETMALYSKTGVSMFGGCLPMLLQFPILFAMFRFFPASFELRQEGFLWAKDLSTYDSILNLPFTIPLFGDHLSLFALLMAISTYLYSRMNIDQMTAGPQMAGMKAMTLYFMPIFLLFLGNNFSSGLSYYYLLSNLMTMLQTWVIRKYFVDEAKIYAKLQERAAKPKKKSKFQERLDAVYKNQQQLKNKR